MKLGLLGGASDGCDIPNNGESDGPSTEPPLNALDAIIPVVNGVFWMPDDEGDSLTTDT
jgi:hypothetical protein